MTKAEARSLVKGQKLCRPVSPGSTNVSIGGQVVGKGQTYFSVRWADHPIRLMMYTFNFQREYREFRLTKGP